MEPVRAVVADGSAPFRSALLKLLSTIPGVTVVAEASSGVEALEIVRKTAPDLLILDIHMPQMNGWEVLRELQSGGDGVRVLVHGGLADKETEQLARQNGAAAFVAKGDVRRLIDTVVQLIQD